MEETILANDGSGTSDGPPQALFVVVHEDGWQRPVPAWLLAWIRLGIAARRWAEGEGRERLVVAVSPPTRAFAAVATAFGHAIADYRRDRRLPTRVELDRQVDALIQGELVRMVQPGWVRVARFGGREGPELIWLGGSKFSLDRILEVMPLPAGLTCRERAFPVPDPAQSLAELLPNRDPSLFLTDTSLVSLLVGIKKALMQELALPIGPAGAPGPLSAIGEFLHPFDPEVPIGWRSVVVSARAEELPPVVACSRPLLAILDGAQAVNNWLRDIDAVVVVVVLDRADPGSDTAALTLTQARAYATPTPLAPLGWTPPQGCEALAFRETR
jgi:hypothetical protein